jgi:hypothetical protein
MSGFQEDCRRQLVAAAGSLFAPAPAARARTAERARTAGRPTLLAAVAFGVLLLAAAAFAAGEIIGVGTPVTANRRLQRPSRSTGVGVPVPGERSRPASARLLPISVPDPAGGLPWGMRIVRTTRGLRCVQVGRLLGGRLGVLGQDGHFRDDGLFHELPVGVLDPDTCSQPGDYALYRSEGLPAAGELPGPAWSCVYPGSHRGLPSGLKRCPAADERLLAFGVLGPHAVSVTYSTQGGPRTFATAGAQGAYLIVLRQPPITPQTLASRAGPLRRRLQQSLTLLESFPTLGSTSSPLGRFPIETGSAVISSVTLRFGRRSCMSGGALRPAALPACTEAMARTPVLRPLIPAGLSTRITVGARKVPRGYELDVAFRAPAAVYDASTAYGIEIVQPGGRACGRGGTSGQSVERDVARGQVVHVTEFVARPRGCHGTIRGRVTLGRQPDALTGPVGGETVGTFSFALP